MMMGWSIIHAWLFWSVRPPSPTVCSIHWRNSSRLGPDARVCWSLIRTCSQIVEPYCGVSGQQHRLGALATPIATESKLFQPSTLYASALRTAFFIFKLTLYYLSVRVLDRNTDDKAENTLSLGIFKENTPTRQISSLSLEAFFIIQPPLSLLSSSGAGPPCEFLDRHLSRQRASQIRLALCFVESMSCL
ncbi:hypothetical protein F5Y12DRAFT_627945 [Xylaria sp. FL1777]|nr:hypothetical protein F5Y12DRAFT_627945 [Xylaria sp. FL1777]